MMEETQMEDLRNADGGAFDQMFVQMMIEHHEGAIETVRVEEANGKNAEAVALAEQIQADQQAEITRMREFLGSWETSRPRGQRRPGR